MSEHRVNHSYDHPVDVRGEPDPSSADITGLPVRHDFARVEVLFAELAYGRV